MGVVPRSQLPRQCQLNPSKSDPNLTLVVRVIGRAEIGSMHRIRLVVIRRLFGKVKELWMLDMGLGTNKGNFEALSEDEYEDWL